MKAEKFVVMVLAGFLIAGIAWCGGAGNCRAGENAAAPPPRPPEVKLILELDAKMQSAMEAANSAFDLAEDNEVKKRALAAMQANYEARGLLVQLMKELARQAEERAERAAKPVK